MTKRLALIAAALLFTAGPALARHCPLDAEAVGHALLTLDVSDEVQAEVMALRDKAMVEHYAGDHAAAETDLAKAMRLLLFNAK